MSKPRDDRQKDLLRPALDQIIDLEHPLACLGWEIDGRFLDERFRSVCRAGPATAAEPAGHRAADPQAPA
jgi:IS5 family transposase